MSDGGPCPPSILSLKGQFLSNDDSGLGHKICDKEVVVWNSG